jgi:hypothetical protein
LIAVRRPETLVWQKQLAGLKDMEVPTLGFVHNARRGARRSKKRDEKEASNLFLQFSERCVPDEPRS